MIHRSLTFSASTRFFLNCLLHRIVSLSSVTAPLSILPKCSWPVISNPQVLPSHAWSSWLRMPDAMRRFCLFIHTMTAAATDWQICPASFPILHWLLTAIFPFFEATNIWSVPAWLLWPMLLILSYSSAEMIFPMLWLSVPFSCFLSGFRFFCPPPPKEGIKKTGLTPVWNICKMHVFYPDWPVLIPASAFLISSHNNYAVNFGYRCLPCRHSWYPVCSCIMAVIPHISPEKPGRFLPPPALLITI